MFHLFLLKHQSFVMLRPQDLEFRVSAEAAERSEAGRLAAAAQSLAAGGSVAARDVVLDRMSQTVCGFYWMFGAFFLPNFGGFHLLSIFGEIQNQSDVLSVSSWVKRRGQFLGTLSHRSMTSVF